MFAGVVITGLVYLIDFTPDYYKYETSILWPILVYIFALPFNMLGGLASIILNIHTTHQGYPGTGHLLNWIFLITTGWLFMASAFCHPTCYYGFTLLHCITKKL